MSADYVQQLLALVRRHTLIGEALQQRVQTEKVVATVRDLHNLHEQLIALANDLAAFEKHRDEQRKRARLFFARLDYSNRGGARPPRKRGGPHVRSR